MVDSRNVAPRRQARRFWCYIGATIATGFLCLALSVVGLSSTDLAAMGSPLLVVGLLLVTAEFRPLIVPGSTDANGITTSTAFVFALLLAFGVGPAVLAQATATLISDKLKHRAWWRTGFNISQYALSWTAAAGVVRLLGLHASPLHPLPLDARQLPAIAAGAATYFVVNDLLVSIALALRARTPLRSEMFADFRYQAAASGTLLAMSPLVVVVMQRSSLLVPLFLLPLAAVYATAAISVEKDHQAQHDPLTGLPNRKLLAAKAAQAFSDASRDHTSVALCLLDLDQFKAINDTRGHHVGDEVLQQVAERVCAVLRPGDVLARLGGDEFAVLIPFTGGPDIARRAAERVWRSLQQPISQKDGPLSVSGSIGVAIYPDHEREYPALLRRADAAMYIAKRSGSGIQMHQPAQYIPAPRKPAHSPHPAPRPSPPLAAAAPE